MKKTMLCILLIAVAFTTSVAQKNNISISNNNGEIRISVQDSKQKLDLKLKGEITFTDDEKGIQSLSNDGTVSFKKDGDKLKITQETDGVLLYVINGKKKLVVDEKDEALVAQCVQTMIAIGVNGKERSQKIYETTGFEGVLKEVNRFESDYVKHTYLNVLGSSDSLSESEMLSFLEKINSQITSDYYKAELLMNFQKNNLKNEVATTAYLNAIKGLGSDHYKTEVIKKFLNGTAFSDVRFEQFMNVASQIENNYYQAAILRSLITDNIKVEKEWSQLIGYTKKIGSDYYQAEILKRIASTMPDNEVLKKEFKEAVAAIKSDYYYASLMRSLND